MKERPPYLHLVPPEGEPVNVHQELEELIKDDSADPFFIKNKIQQALYEADITQYQHDLLIDLFFKRIIKKVADLEKEIRTLKEKESINPTTNLPDRATLEARLGDWIAELKEKESKIGAIMVLAFDIDSVLKEINDQFGHEEGDKLLRAFGKHLTEVTKLGDDLISYSEATEVSNEEKKLIAHPHGDEFRAVLRIRRDLSGLTQGELDSFFEKIFNRIKRDVNTGLSITIGSKTFEIKCSAGYSVLVKGQKDKNVRELIKEADENERKDKPNRESRKKIT